MIAFICYFFPAVISVWLFEALTKKSLKLKEIIFRFCTNTLIINFCCFAIKKFILSTEYEHLCSAQMDMLPIVAFNYIVITVPIAIAIVIFEVLISKKVKITIEEESNEKEAT